jgi:BlaI family transcriptional regulator, penicillinase repressor
MSPQSRLVSDTELAVLKVLWDLGQGSVRDVLDAASGGGERDWAYTTVQTLLNRLQEKGFLESEKKGRAFVFRPVVTRDDLLGRSLNELASRVCDGAAMPLLLNLVRSTKFDKSELDSFRALLDAQGDAPSQEGEDGK